MSKLNGGSRWLSVIGWILIAVLAVCTIYPLALSVMISLKTTRDFTLNPTGLPSELNWSNYIQAWNDGNFGRLLPNTVLVTVSTIVLTIAFTSPAGFALAKLKLKGSGLMYNYLMAGMVIPFQTIMIPLMRICRQLQLYNRLYTIIAIFTATSVVLPVLLYTSFYNTLQMISDYAAVSDGDEVSAICGRLSSIFRYSLESSDRYVFFSEEIEHVQNYIYIQSIRMNNRFAFVTDVSEACSNIYTPRLILQPIVENAVTHGIYSKMEGARITVSAEIADSSLYVKVSDNGVGMTLEVLTALRKRMDESITPANLASESIGLSNVHRRLVLSYGPESGLVIESSPGSGTEVSFRIPVSSEKKGAWTHDKNGDR